MVPYPQTPDSVHVARLRLMLAEIAVSWHGFIQFLFLYVVNHHSL